MSFLLHLTDLSPEPLHGQISRQVRAKVLAGEMKEGQALPSIRGLAREQRVSVITVQRAYEDLQRDGLIVSHRGKGYFVAPMSSRRKKTMAQNRLLESLKPLLAEARAEGLTLSDIRQLIDRLMKESENKT